MSKKCSYLSKPISRNFNSWLQDRINGASHKRCLRSHGTAASGNDRPSYFHSSISLPSKRSKERESEPLHTRRQPQSFPLRCVYSKSVSLQKKHPNQPRLHYRSLGGSQTPLQAVRPLSQKRTLWPWIASFCLQPRWPLLHVLLLWSRDGAAAERDAGTVQKALKCHPRRRT